MSRLIDVDTLKFPNIAVFDMKLHGVTVPMVRLIDLKMLIPAIKAIPIDWIKSKIEETKDNPFQDVHEAFKVVLSIWEHEQKE